MPKSNYPSWVLNNIPQMTFTNTKFVPWSFKAANSFSPTKLVEIVPERISDKKTGKEYVLLFHGKTSDTKDIFMKGANIYFRRNATMHNQFVFFSNVKPYLKIFYAVSLGTGFGMAENIDEEDGIQEGDFTPDNDNSFKCAF